jgi:DNA-binding transcriptional LysR family regulator
MFEYLDYIYEVYKERNFTRAAEKLFISQSSLSLTIKKAEQQIGAEIFDRGSKPLSLTEFGKAYIAACEQVLALRSDLENHVYDLNHLQKGSISIGAGNFFATYLVAPFLAEFKEEHPNITVNLVEGRSMDLRVQLEKGDLDVLVTNADLTSPDLEREVLFSEQLLLTVPRGRIDPEGLEPIPPEALGTGPYTSYKPFDLKLVKSIPVVGLRPGNDTRLRTDLIYKAQGLRPTYLLEVDQSSTAFNIACNQAGVSVTADTVIRTLLRGRAVDVFYLDSPHACRDVCAYTNVRKYRSKILERFLDEFPFYAKARREY